METVSPYNAKVIRTGQFPILVRQCIPRAPPARGMVIFSFSGGTLLIHDFLPFYRGENKKPPQQTHFYKPNRPESIAKTLLNTQRHWLPPTIMSNTCAGTNCYFYHLLPHLTILNKDYSSHYFRSFKLFYCNVCRSLYQ